MKWLIHTCWSVVQIHLTAQTSSHLSLSASSCLTSGASRLLNRCHMTQHTIKGHANQVATESGSTNVTGRSSAESTSQTFYPNKPQSKHKARQRAGAVSGHRTSDTNYMPETAVLHVMTTFNEMSEKWNSCTDCLMRNLCILPRGFSL